MGDNISENTRDASPRPGLAEAYPKATLGLGNTTWGNFVGVGAGQWRPGHMTG